jgi:hypothetical protein
MNRFDEDKAMNENEAAAQPGDGTGLTVETMGFHAL